MELARDWNNGENRRDERGEWSEGMIDRQSENVEEDR
jgi:hypothetical protein